MIGGFLLGFLAGLILGLLWFVWRLDSEGALE